MRRQRFTGRRRVRVGFLGKLILQIEIESPLSRYPSAPPPPGTDPWENGSYTFWRDAKLADLNSVSWAEPQAGRADG